MAGFQRASALIQGLGAELRDLRRIHAQYVAVWNFQARVSPHLNAGKGNAAACSCPHSRSPYRLCSPSLPCRCALACGMLLFGGQCSDSAGTKRAASRIARTARIPRLMLTNLARLFQMAACVSSPHAREPSAAIQMAACVSPPHAREPNAAIQMAACVSPPHAREPSAAIQMAACVSPPRARGNDSRPDCAMQK